MGGERARGGVVKRGSDNDAPPLRIMGSRRVRASRAQKRSHRRPGANGRTARQDAARSLADYLADQSDAAAQSLADYLADQATARSIADSFADVRDDGVADIPLQPKSKSIVVSPK